MLILPRAVTAPPSARRHRVQRPRPRQAHDLGMEHHTVPMRHPRIPVLAGSYPSAGVVAVKRYRQDGRDWRKLSPAEVVRQLLACSLPPLRISKGSLAAKGDGSLAAAVVAPACQRREGLMAALATGVLQATEQGSYWAPGFGLPETVECRSVRQPVSRLLLPVQPEPLQRPTGNVQVPALCCSPDHSALGLCLEFALEQDRPRTALVKFGAAGVLPGLDADFASLELREAEVLLRTNYLKALLDLEKHIHIDVCAALEAGHLIHTSDVSILRGPVEDGAQWLGEAPSIDIIWVPLPRSVLFKEDEHQVEGYGDAEQQTTVAIQLRRAISAAAAAGVQNLVLTPPGAGQHPAVGVAELLREATLACGHGLRQVVLCREFEDQLQGRWTAMSSAFVHGVERIKIHPWLEVKKAALARLHWDKFKPGYEASLRKYSENPSGYARRLGKYPPPSKQVCDEERPQTSRAAAR